MSKTLFEKLNNTVTPAMATPLDSSGYKVSIPNVAPLVEFLIARGVGGLFPGGTTGEGILLSMDERKGLHEATISASNGRVPVLVHVGCNNTRDTVEMAVHAESISADAIVVVTPWFYPLDDDALLNYYKAVAAEAPNTPLLVYDIPHFANNGITPALAKRIVDEVPTFAGLKCSRGDGQMIRSLIMAQPDDKLFLAGNERIMIGSLSMGAHGAISGLSTAVPEPFVAMVNAHAAGDMAEAQKWHRLINKLLDIAGPYGRLGGIKRILANRGVDVGEPMPPRAPVKEAVWPELLKVFAEFGERATE